MTRRFALMTALAALSAFAQAGEWRNLTEAKHLANGTLAPEDLLGKVVLVDFWSTTVQPSRNIQPRVEKIWQGFRDKAFAVVGSVAEGAAEEVAAFAAKNRITFPMYSRLAYDNKGPGDKAPYFFVIDARGRLVYAGESDRDATEAAVTAIGKAATSGSLAGDYVFGRKSRYKTFERQLVLGKNVKPVIKKLEGDAAKATKKTATRAQVEQAYEAKRLLEAIDAAKAELREEIACLKKGAPERALKLMKDFTASFPDEGAAYKNDIAALTETVRAKKEGATK